MSTVDIEAIDEIYSRTAQSEWELDAGSREIADTGDYYSFAVIEIKGKHAAYFDEMAYAGGDVDIQKGNAEFSVVAHNKWPAISDEIKRLRAENATMLDTIKAMLVACGGSEDDHELKAQLDAAGSKPSDFVAAIGGRLLGLILNWTSSGRYGYSLPVIQVDLMSDIERILRGENRVEFVRQVPDGKGGFVDRLAYPSLRELQDAVKSPGASGARGIMRDNVTGEAIVIVEPSRCDHKWKEFDSQFTSETETDVTCLKCGIAGSRDNGSGEVFYPAT